MPKCPVCMREPFEKGECKNCGYSIACDYEKYPTFARIQAGTPSKAGRKRALRERRGAEELREAEARRKAVQEVEKLRAENAELQRMKKREVQEVEKLRAEIVELRQRENRKYEEERETEKLRAEIVQLKQHAEKERRTERQRELREKLATKQEYKQSYERLLQEKNEVEQELERARVEAVEFSRRQKMQQRRWRIALAILLFLTIGSAGYMVYTGQLEQLCITSAVDNTEQTVQYSEQLLEPTQNAENTGEQLTLPNLLSENLRAVVAIALIVIFLGALVSIIVLLK